METERRPVVVREGAAARTADELLSVFLGDAQGLGVELAPYGKDVESRVDAALDANRLYGAAWLPEDAEALRDELVTVADQAEAALCELGYSVEWEDGYVIFPAGEDDE